MIRQSQLELVQRAEEIEALDALAAGMVGYSARLWAQMSLPYRDPGDLPCWERSNGGLKLIVEPGYVERAAATPGGQRTVVRAYPYGVMPRLLMTWMATEAVRLKSPELMLGSSLAEFLRALNLGRDGRTIRKLREQIQLVASARLVLMDQRAVDRTRTDYFQVASATELWWGRGEPDVQSLLPSMIVLSHEFFTSIVERPIPVDLRALTALRGNGASGLPIDIYIWLTHRMSYLRRPTNIPWAFLANQFGSQYGRARDFRAEFLKALPKVLLVYPASVSVTDTGLLLSPSKTSVKRSPKPLRK